MRHPFRIILVNFSRELAPIIVDALLRLHAEPRPFTQSRRSRLDEVS
jgi:hypothetical protein